MKLKIGLALGLILLAIAGWSGTSFATSWMDLKPEEVEKRAEIVVLGRYDFASKPGDNPQFIWASYDFQVEKVYKGAAEASLRAGIDGFDVGWAKEFQDKGGMFLLFLEKEQKNGLPVPVAGPNGMIQLSDGKVQHHDAAEAAYFTKYLERRSGDAPTAGSDSRRSGGRSIVYGGAAGVLAILLLLVLILLRRRKLRA
jgi:hypothetical protein